MFQKQKVGQMIELIGKRFPHPLNHKMVEITSVSHNVVFVKYVEEAGMTAFYRKMVEDLLKTTCLHP